MTSEEELVEYLRYILESRSKNYNIVGTYNDYAQKAEME